MVQLLRDKSEEIAELCRRFRVARLEVFGSASTGPFDPSRSDVDFIVEFRAGESLGPWLAQYFGFQAAMEGLLGRSVDLVMPKAMKNPYFIKEVNRTRQLVYAS